MNTRRSRDGGAVLGIFLGLLCLLFAGYFALMGLFNYIGREPNPGMGSLGVVMCGVSLWGAYRCARWGFGRKEQSQEEKE